MMSGPSNVYCMDQREAGYRDEIRALGLTYQNIFKLEDVTYASARACVSAMQTLDIDAIACVNDMMAMGVINELNSRGTSIPGDIAVAGYDDLIFSKISPVPITTVKQDLTQVADIAARMIVGLIKAEEVQEEVVIDCQVVHRDSTARP
ncbi:MAG: substrate-binding domain-containing protein [Firmicutes bacterium]|nr:substrate-binding domain-containing protein [Bacillota bacterium]